MDLTDNKINYFLDDINFAAEANKKITKNCIEKCFINCGFNFPVQHDNETISIEREEVQNMIQTLYEGNTSAGDFITIDNVAITGKKKF